MPLGLKITIVFNFIAVAILFSVASMAEPSKITLDSHAQAPIFDVSKTPIVANNLSTEVDRSSNQSSTKNAEENREATPAPWTIRADGSVLWQDSP